MIRQKINFMSAFVEYCEGSEMLPHFTLWCGLAGISACLGRRVWLPFGTMTLFPNLYVILVGSSGTQRKSTTVNAMGKLLWSLTPTPRIIAQQITPEKLVEDLKSTEVVDSQNNPIGTLTESCTGFALIDELTTFLRVQTYDAGLGTLLIKMFDCPDKYEYRTKTKGVALIENGCLGLLGATTVQGLRDAVPERAIGDGLTSRILFVYADEKPKPVPLPTLTNRQRELFDQMIQTLQHFQTLRGEFHLDDDAMKFYCDVYKQHWETPMYDDPLLSGYTSRWSTHLLKLAMILSICESDSLMIALRHVQAAVRLLEGIEPQLQTVMSLISSTDKGASINFVRSLVRRSKGPICHADLARAANHRMDAYELEGILQTLLRSGEIVGSHNNGKVIYQKV
jgi:hypothetical protein